MNLGNAGELLKNLTGGNGAKGLDVATASIALSKIVNDKSHDSASILEAVKLFLNTQEKGKNQLVDTVRDFINSNTGTSVAIIDGIKNILSKNAPKEAEKPVDSNIASVAGNLLGGLFGK